MSKHKQEEDEVADVSIAKSDRQDRWEAHLATFKKSNPEKYEARKKAGELSDAAPASFV